jgi:hypothetical protein
MRRVRTTDVGSSEGVSGNIKREVKAQLRRERVVR